MWSAAMAGYFRARLDDVGHLIDPGLLAVVERAASLSAADLANALQQRNTYYTGMREFMDFQRFNLLLTPTLPVTAFTAGLDEPDTWQRATLAPLDWTPFTFPFNLTGQPAATVPCGFDKNGLPVGLQIVGRWRNDSTVLRAAAAFESAMPWTTSGPHLIPLLAMGRDEDAGVCARGERGVDVNDPGTTWIEADQKLSI